MEFLRSDKIWRGGGSEKLTRQATYIQTLESPDKSLRSYEAARLKIMSRRLTFAILACEMMS